jgi:predicted  nucleic acid-binding Zn-ribbon protein
VGGSGAAPAGRGGEEELVALETQLSLQTERLREAEDAVTSLREALSAMSASHQQQLDRLREECKGWEQRYLAVREQLVAAHRQLGHASGPRHGDAGAGTASSALPSTAEDTVSH